MPTCTSVAFTKRSTRTCSSYARPRSIACVSSARFPAFASPTRRAFAARLDDRREAEARVDLFELVEIGPGRHVVRRRRHVVQAEHLLGLELVHRQGAREHARYRCTGRREAPASPGCIRPHRRGRAARGRRRRRGRHAASRPARARPGPTPAARLRGPATRAPWRRPRPSAARRHALRSVRPSAPRRAWSSWDSPRKVSYSTRAPMARADESPRACAARASRRVSTGTRARGRPPTR